MYEVGLGRGRVMTGDVAVEYRSLERRVGVRVKQVDRAVAIEVLVPVVIIESDVEGSFLSLRDAKERRVTAESKRPPRDKFFPSTVNWAGTSTSVR